MACWHRRATSCEIFACVVSSCIKAWYTFCVIQIFAKSGLRTLVLAEKDISQEYFDEWMKRYHEARYFTLRNTVLHTASSIKVVLFR